MYLFKRSMQIQFYNTQIVAQDKEMSIHKIPIVRYDICNLSATNLIDFIRSIENLLILST